MRVLLAGEGPTELGDWHRERAWRPSPCAPGVVEALARGVGDGDWVIADAVSWKSIRKYRPGGHRHAEARNVLGVVLMARERGMDAVLFVRDRDGLPERGADVETGMRAAAGNRDFRGVAIVGGIAVEAIEAWLLAWLGEPRTEEATNPKAELARRGYGSCEAKVSLVREHDAAGIPEDAQSLRTWLDRVRRVFGPAAEPVSG
ncbi:MAG: hypothetical protein HY905_04455 [Deltaproteobacteria bacterium]|nr:hypothetical protein [Deltaproteobacteria bacterium]